VVTAPVMVRRDGTVLAGAWLPDLVRLGELDFEDGPDRGWLPDGSRPTWLNAPSGKKADRLPVRVTEHNTILPAGDGTEEASQACTVITMLLDHQAAPAGAVRETYLTRWSAAETTFGEDKTTITGARKPGLADRHPTGAHQCRRSAPQRSRAGALPAPQSCPHSAERPVPEYSRTGL
jgi:hypothetical protein